MSVISTSTKITDVVVPEIFTPYVIEKTAEKSKILTSGIATQNAKLNQLVTAGGTTMNMPFWQDLSGDDEVLDDNTALTPGKITASKDVAVLLMRGRAWGANDLSGALAGDDPMNAIADRVSDYWARREQKTLVSMLSGVFASTTMANHIYDGSSSTISAELVLSAKQLLGDAADQLQAILMHSATFTKLQKENLIQYVDSRAGKSDSPVMIPTYLGYNVVVDDGMPKSTSVTTPGVYTLSITTAATAGDKIAIGDTVYTFVANNTASPTATEIKVGADGTAAQQATNIAAKLNGESAGLKDTFTIAVANSTTVTFTNKTTEASTAPAVLVTKAATTGTLVAAMATTTTEVETTVYTTYLFARGVIARGEGTPVSFVNTETDRDSLGGEDYLINRRAFVLHMFGVKWVGQAAGDSPTNAELAVGTNWVRVYEDKNIGVVALTHKV